jgi:hypothetical protein
MVGVGGWWDSDYSNSQYINEVILEKNEKERGRETRLKQKHGIISWFPCSRL